MIIMSECNSNALQLRKLVLLSFAVYNLVVFAVLGSPEHKITSYTAASASSAASASITSLNSLFGVRGGAFFGRFGRSSRSRGDDAGGGGDDDGPKRYPALSKDEIEEKLNIPVFGLTDTNGNGVVLSDEEGANIFHFFFSRHMADAALRAVMAANAGAPPLQVSAFHLGKCWFNLIEKSGSQTYTLKKYGMDVGRGTDETKPVNFRLVPNMKDLMGARILTGLKTEDMQRLRDAVEEPNPQKALSIIRGAANSDASSFSCPFDEIPVFAIAQMRVRKRGEDGVPVGEHMMPFHLSAKTMSETWNEFVTESPQFGDAEATLQLVELHKMIEMMQEESDFDFRRAVFIQPDYDKDDPNNDALDDSDDDDSDDGDGGDNGMKVDSSSSYDGGSIEPFVSMEIFADAPEQGQTLVQL